MATGHTDRETNASTGDIFGRTRWSIILATRGPDSVRATAALEQLCSTYWYPLYSYIRRRGNSPEDAQDLTQTFFVRLLEKNWLDAVAPEKGRFRAFLLAAVKHFLANEWDRTQAQKRGGGRTIVSWDAMEAEARFRQEPTQELPVERLFDRKWALTVLERVLTRLREKHAGNLDLFDAVQQYLSSEADPSAYAEIARRLGTSESVVKVTIHRLRKRYVALLHEEIAQTVSSPKEVDEEIRYLLSCL